MPDAWIPQTNSFLAAERRIWLRQAYLCKKLPRYCLSLPALICSEEAEKPDINYWINPEMANTFTHMHIQLIPSQPLSDPDRVAINKHFCLGTPMGRGKINLYCFFSCCHRWRWCPLCSLQGTARGEVWVWGCDPHGTVLAEESQILSWSRV